MLISKAFKAVFLIGALFFASQGYSQCLHCNAPAVPTEYGGTFNATMYKNATVQLWATKASIAVDGRQWYRVKKAGDTTFVGYGDTMVFTMDTTSKFICRNINNCTCGGTYYSTYAQMANITVVDSPSVPQYWLTYDSVICSGSPTNIFAYTSSSLSAFNVQYFRDDTPSVTGSVTGTAAIGPLGVTLTNTTGTTQTVRMMVRLYRSGTYFDSKSFYIKVLPSAPSGSDHCSFPSKPNPWPNNVHVNSYAKGAHVQFLADTTVMADTVKWYKVVGTDTSYVGKGYSIAVTMDTTAKYLARNFNACNCNSGVYRSAYTLMANNTVSVNYVSHIIPLQIMDTIASGTGINILTKTDTSSRIQMIFWRDNANVTGSINQTTIDNYTGTEGFDAILTNTTNVPQRIRYKIYSLPYAVPGSHGDTYTGYFTVMPSTFGAPSGNHCYIPPRENNGTAQICNYSPGALVYLDLNHWGFINGTIWTFSITADAVEWYRVRGSGDTVFVGEVTPVSTVVDTTIKIFTVSKNICYWSDGSKHIYRSVPTFVGQLTKSATAVATPTHTNNQPSVCTGTTPDLTYTGAGAGFTAYRNQPIGITGSVAIVKGSTALHTDSIISDTIANPVKVYYVGYRNSAATYSSNVLDSITVYPSCSKWANFSTVIHALKDSIYAGDTATLTADTVPGPGSHYLWSTGDTTKTIHPTAAGTYTVTVTNSCGCSAMASRSVWINPLNPPAIISWNSACTNGMHYFRLDSILATAGYDSIEWAHFKNYAFSEMSKSPANIVDSLYSGYSDTLWIRCKNTAGYVSRDTIAVFVNYPKPYPPMIQNAVQSFVSATPVTVPYEGITFGTLGNLLEWSFDSLFSSIYTSDTSVNISIIDSPGQVKAIWFRTSDTISGCVSDPTMAMALTYDHKLDSIPPTYATISVCVGNSALIPVPSSSIGTMYYLRQDYVIKDSLMGTGDTIKLSSGAIDSFGTFCLTAMDTSSRTVFVLDSAIFIEGISEVDSPFFVEGDHILYVGDTVFPCYDAIAKNATSIVYSIDSGGGALIDSTTGCISSVTADFTVRVHAVGVTSCGDKWTSLQVQVNNIGLPIIPLLSSKVVDSPQIITYIIDSLMPGSGADVVQVSLDESFKFFSTVTPGGKYAIEFYAPRDTFIWVRSENLSTHKVSRAIKALISGQLRLISAGLLDKSQWDLNRDISDEFNAYENTPASFRQFIRENKRKWALNLYWNGDPTDDSRTVTMTPTHCGNHFIDAIGNNQEVFNSGNMSGGLWNDDAEGSGGEVYFANGIAHLKASPLANSITDCDNGSTRTYKSGMLANYNPLPVWAPTMMEVRVKRPPEGSAYLQVGQWVRNIPTNSLAAWLDGNGKDDFHLEGYSNCNLVPRKITPCDFKDDYHTMTWVNTGDESIFFADGKELWSQAMNSALMASYAADPTKMAFFGMSMNASFSPTFSSAEFLIDYFRFYTAKSNRPTFFQPLQNVTGLGFKARTLENPNTPMPLQANTYITTTPRDAADNNHSIGSWSFALHSYFFYKTRFSQIYRLEHVGNTWTKLRLNQLTSIFPDIQYTDVKDFISPANDGLVFFQTVNNGLGFFYKSGNTWLEAHARTNGRQIDFCNGYIVTDQLGRQIFRGTDGDIYFWYQNVAAAIATGGEVRGALASSKCGCLEFYVDELGNLHQWYWWNTWHDLGIVVAGNVSNDIVLDERHSRLYYIGSDHYVYYYKYSYDRITSNGTVRLGHNSTESLSAVPLCTGNALSNLAMSTDGNALYYRGTDGLLWYFFNDNEDLSGNAVSQLPNWNKTPLTISNILGPIQVAPEFGGDRLLYADISGNLQSPSWVTADIPTTDCTDITETHYDYKNKPIYFMPDSIMLDNIQVTVFPNPSQDNFTITIDSRVTDVWIGLEILAMDGKSLYTASRQISGSSSDHSFVWNAKAVNSGIYFVNLHFGDGRRASRKLIKI